MTIIKCYNKACDYWDENETDNCSHPIKEIQKCSCGIIRKENPAKSKNFYYEQLMSNECFCGEYKQKRYSFCFICYHELPEEIREELSRHKIGQGYEAAYEAAVKSLES